MSYYIIIRGPLGSGKSTIAERLSQMLNGKYIAIDRILDQHSLTKDKEEGYVSQRSFLKANKIVIPEAKNFLKKNIPVIFDGNFYWKSQIENLVNKLNYPYYVFTLKAALEVCIKRDSKRKKTHGKDAVEAVYRKSTEFDYGIIIDIGNKIIDQTLKEILNHLPKYKK